MPSIPTAIVWEMFYRSRWVLLLAAVGANFLPLLLENQFLTVGGPDFANEPAQITIQIMLVQWYVLMYGWGAFAAIGNLSRLYASPIKTSALVMWPLLAAMLLIFLEMAASILMLNAVFGFHWPAWGAALFAAAMLPAVTAAVWQAEKSVWAIVFMTAAIGIPAVWFKARHGVIIGEATHYWDQITPLEILTVLLFAGISLYASIKGVARSRRGDFLRPWGILAWFERLFDMPPECGPAFASPAAAHFWFVWRQKGWAMPGSVILGMGLGMLWWLIISRKADDLVMGFVGGGGILTMVAIIVGFTIGNCGPSDSSFEMGNFIGTRPMTSAEMSRIVLQTTVKTVAYAWIFWAAGFAVVASILLLLGHTPPAQIHLNAAWWYFPATLLGPWLVASLGASLGLTGRSWIFVALACAAFPIMIAYIVLTENLLSDETKLLLGQYVAGAFGVLFVLYTIVLYVRARHRELIDSAVFYRATLVWLIGSTLAVGLIKLYPGMPFSNVVLVSGLLALVVAPFPAAPLALAWNRIR